MRYLVLSADYFGYLRDEFSGKFALDEVPLPQELVRRVEEWLNEYRPIISMNDKLRGLAGVKIDALDATGKSLAIAIAANIRGGAKVKYFSEGLLRYLEADFT